MATKALMTVEEFAAMDTAEDYELVDGELIPLPRPILFHCLIQGRLVQAVGNYFDGNPIGGAIAETHCRVAADTVRKPSLSIFLGERWLRLDFYSSPAPYAPDIAVEVLSASAHIVEVNRKVRDCFNAGSKEVWLLDYANGEVHVRAQGAIRLLQGDDVLESALLPGFSIRVADLLADR